MATAQEKGERHEREAVNIISAAYGTGGTEKVDVYTNHDPFGLADIIAIRADRPVLLVQVKTNRLRPTTKRRYLRDCIRRIPPEAIFEVWVRKDRAGWEMIRFNGEEPYGFNTYAEFDACDPSDVRDEWRELFLLDAEGGR